MMWQPEQMDYMGMGRMQGRKEEEGTAESRNEGQTRGRRQERKESWRVERVQSRR